jgi:hypothetical protein
MTMKASSNDRHVCLRGGLCVSVGPLALLLDLERRGFPLTPQGDDQISVRPFSQLTDEDKSGLRRWRRHIRALMAYQPPPNGSSQPSRLHREAGASWWWWWHITRHAGTGRHSVLR